MTGIERRLTRVGAAVGGLLAAALLPAAAALADDYAFTPDPATLVPTQAEGFPPLVNEVTGSEMWGIDDLTTNHLFFADILRGIDTETTFGSFTNDDFVVADGGGLVITGTVSGTYDILGTSQLDLMNFGGGFENEWIDIAGPNAGVSDLLITPFGDFTLYGTGFADLSAVLP